MRQTCFTFIVIIIVSAGFFFRGAPFAFAGGPQGSGVIVPDGSANCGGAGTLCEWAWNDVAGWVDFCVPVSGNCTLPVTVSDTELG
jgi:hypothetical protein